MSEKCNNNGFCAACAFVNEVNKDKKIRIGNGNNGLCTKREARHGGQSDGRALKHAHTHTHTQHWSEGEGIFVE